LIDERNIFFKAVIFPMHHLNDFDTVLFHEVVILGTIIREMLKASTISLSSILLNLIHSEALKNYISTQPGFIKTGILIGCNILL
jgi:hypothetical protein